MNFFLKLKPLKAKINLLKRLVFIAYIDNVIKKTIYHRKNKHCFKNKKIKISLRHAPLHPPWKNPGYGPDCLDILNIYKYLDIAKHPWLGTMINNDLALILFYIAHCIYEYINSYLYQQIYIQITSDVYNYIFLYSKNL